MFGSGVAGGGGGGAGQPQGRGEGAHQGVQGGAPRQVQGHQLNMSMFFWYLVKSKLS